MRKLHLTHALLLCLLAFLCRCFPVAAENTHTLGPPALLATSASPALSANKVTTSTDSARTDSVVPRAALLRSALLPGWGQLYNGKPYKAAFFATVSTGLLSIAVAEQLALNNAQTPFESEERAARRNTRILFFALSVTFAALDAYVDAHLADLSSNWSTEMRADGALLTLHVDLLP
jgi:hypothetical protein